MVTLHLPSNEVISSFPNTAFIMQVSESHSLAPTDLENQVQSLAWHSLLYPFSSVWTSLLLLFCLYPVLQPSWSDHLTSVSCSFPASITLFHLPESLRGFPCPQSCTVLGAMHHLWFPPQTLVPLCVCVWTLGSPGREGSRPKTVTLDKSTSLGLHLLC